MRLSIIIVSYNVKYFLEQCLCSVSKALAAGGLNVTSTAPSAEVFVVDNNSVDGSIDYLRSRFPFVQFISNAENVGFAKANNQALQQCKGMYVLFLNPDTILPEDIFTATLDFMNRHPKAGSLGVRMIDGSGKFLKESKRGLPTAWASFCKMSGLTALFPSSKIFSKYYVGHLPENKTQQVPVLPGAFMMVRKETLDKTGGFDERFFMYAEDIDLSYRILQQGYENYYFAEASIIHFKGESTSKDARYVKLFYKAMQQFVEKHYRSGSGVIFRGMLGSAIALRAGIAQLQRKKSLGKQDKPEIIKEGSLIGDNNTIAQLSSLLNQHNISIQTDSNTIIFCEGNAYSYKQVIEQLQQLKPDQKALIHSGGSGSVVGSFDKDGQGIGMAI